MTFRSADSVRPIDPGRFLIMAAGAITLWLVGLFLLHFTFGHGRQITHILFLDQDFPALLLALTGLVLFSPLARSTDVSLPLPTARLVLPLILICALWSWAGHYLVFQDYALSRDEEVAEFGAAYLRDGLLSRPIPPEWLEYRRAIMPEFFSPFGAENHWTAAYLPVNSAIRALFWHLGDPNLAGPILLAIGLIALWRVALRLFPNRPDAVWVAMLLAFTSAQLSVTAMTPYAMTGHFALNMVWLALVLRGGWLGHGCAVVVAIVAGGLHQYHFPPIFLAPFLLWMVLGRRWAAFLVHFAALVVLVILWAKLWPGFLLHELGPPADVRASAGVGDKAASLLRRLGNKWQPLFNLSRFMAWNNILMVPLAVLGVAAMKWRGAVRGETVVLPLAIGCIAACVFALWQGYGWGFRYAHGFIGPFCLLAAYGWVRLGAHSLWPVLFASVLALVTGAFLTDRAHDYVAPYAASHRMIHAANADVVLVDPRGGLFATDLVRSEHGDMKRPMVMNLAMLTPSTLDRLCANYSVRLFDRSAFRPLGLRASRLQPGYLDRLRAHLDAIGCAERLPR
ncbi:MFS transporter [Sphingobium phenoxybenzoativorans]|uniref:MFS transporter n=1 Tax=Sphingobium phenoxybenzoativorans TaxID=1592790 RepID=UPI000871ECE9